jgi:hypothetical protein
MNHFLLFQRTVLPTGLRWLLLCSLLLTMLAHPARGQDVPSYQATIPSQSDWLECGPIFTAGNEGEWDYYLWGGFASSVVKKNGIFYLYYQGANGYDDDEETATWRSIGVATSNDGIHFTKYAQNPVLTWFPQNNLEEGATSAAAFLDTTGEIAVYYGANTWAGGSSVNADGRLAVSIDGFHLADQGIVLNRKNHAVWGWGDELYPIIGFQNGGRWLAYYIPNGTPQKGQLGVAWGDSRLALTNTAPALSGGNNISAWGPGSFARLAGDTYALFLNDVYREGGAPILEVRIVSLNAPASLSAPVQSYQFDDVWEAVVFLDSGANTWFMYYRSADHNYYGVKVAAADGGDATCDVTHPEQIDIFLPLISKQSAIQARVSLPLIIKTTSAQPRFTRRVRRRRWITAANIQKARSRLAPPDS